MKPRIPRNSFLSIEARRYGTYSRSMKSTYRYNNRLMRNLIASDDWGFKRVMKVRNAKGVAFDCHGKLYTENQRNCFTLRGARGEPTLMYSIDVETHPGNRRYESYLTILRPGLSNPNPPRCDLRLLLTSTSFLEVREENTGKLIDIIDLGSPDTPDVKFLAMRHDPNLDQIIVTSTKPNGSDVVRNIIILEFCPVVRKTLRMQISRTVFGRDALDVDLFDGILRVLYKKEIVKMYDFKLICQNNRIVEGAHDPVLLIQNIGEPLYVVEGTNLMIEMDGFPFHYIACAESRNEYSVRTMDHKKVATFSFDENDELTFHPDGSGIISHTDRTAITFYKLKAGENGGESSLEKVRSIKIIGTSPINDAEKIRLHGYAVPVRRSQRPARRPPSLSPEPYEEERIVFSDDFENELCLNVLIGNDNTDPHRRGVMQLFDNDTGEHVKTMKFSRRFRLFTDYLVILDLDVLVVISTEGGGTVGEAHVYRLLHRETWGDECPKELYDPPCVRKRLNLNLDLEYVP